MYTRKQALALAKQFRTCPPPFIRNHPDFKAENENHLRICPFCSIGSPHGVQEWQELSENWRKQFLDDKKQPAILPGQIWQVKPELGYWRDDLYYNPPQVMILGEIDEISHGVRVAQVWHDISLASPRDLVPLEDSMSGFEELFIETWNMYTLRKSDLGFCLGKVSSQVVDQALKMNEDPEYLPETARRPMPLADEDPRLYFQKIEIETGYTFASMAVDALMNEVDAVIKKQVKTDFLTTSLSSFSVSSLVKAIKEYIPTIGWEWVPDTIEECLAALKFPTESFALSAADEDYRKINAVYLKLRNGKINQIRPIECIIHHADSQPDSYKVSGEIPGLPENLSQDAFQCHIKNTGEKFLFQGSLSWDSEEKHFIAEFDRPLKSHEKLTITIIHDPTEENTYENR